MVRPRRTRNRAGAESAVRTVHNVPGLEKRQTFPDGVTTACPTDSASVFA